MARTRIDAGIFKDERGYEVTVRHGAHRRVARLPLSTRESHLREVRRVMQEELRRKRAGLK